MYTQRRLRARYVHGRNRARSLWRPTDYSLIFPFYFEEIFHFVEIQPAYFLYLQNDLEFSK